MQIRCEYKLFFFFIEFTYPLCINQNWSKIVAWFVYVCVIRKRIQKKTRHHHTKRNHFPTPIHTHLHNKYTVKRNKIYMFSLGINHKKKCIYFKFFHPFLWFVVFAVWILVNLYCTCSIIVNISSGIYIYICIGM